MPEPDHDEAEENVLSGEAVQGPRLQIVKGDASPEEIAALVAVLTARARAAASAEAAETASANRRRGSAWADRARLVRGQVAHGPGAWRASARPS